MGNGTYLSFFVAERRRSAVSCTRRAANVCRLRWTFSNLLHSYSVIWSIAVAAVLCDGLPQCVKSEKTVQQKIEASWASYAIWNEKWRECKRALSSLPDTWH